VATRRWKNWRYVYSFWQNTRTWQTPRQTDTACLVLRRGGLPVKDAVTHPGTNRAWCRVTTLIETNVLPLRQTGNQPYGTPYIFVTCTSSCLQEMSNLLRRCFRGYRPSTASFWRTRRTTSSVKVDTNTRTHCSVSTPTRARSGYCLLCRASPKTDRVFRTSLCSAMASTSYVGTLTNSRCSQRFLAVAEHFK